MLVYIECMCKIMNIKYSVDGMLVQELLLLYVRVKYILKFFVIKNKIRRLVFFDEFIGKNVNLNLNKLRREKLKLVLRFLFLLLLDCYKKNFYNVKISFVSVFDLYDIVDFSI